MEDVYRPREGAATQRHDNRREYVFELQNDSFVDDYEINPFIDVYGA